MSGSEVLDPSDGLLWGLTPPVVWPPAANLQVWGAVPQDLSYDTFSTGYIAGVSDVTELWERQEDAVQSLVSSAGQDMLLFMIWMTPSAFAYYFLQRLNGKPRLQKQVCSAELPRGRWFFLWGYSSHSVWQPFSQCIMEGHF